MFHFIQWNVLLLLTPVVLGGCLKASEAERILNRYVSLFQDIEEDVAKNTLTKDFSFYSDSLDFLFTPGLPGSISGQPFWSSRDGFIAGQSQGQEERAQTSTKFEFRILQWRHGCEHIVFHWRGDGRSKANIPGSTNQKGDPVGEAGIDFLILRTDSTPKKVQTVYSEFNLGEVLYTSGQKVCFQKDNPDACTCPNNNKRLTK